jgi:hypothetical protein
VNENNALRAPDFPAPAGHFCMGGECSTRKSYILMIYIQLQILYVTKMNNKFNFNKKIGKILNIISGFVTENRKVPCGFKEQMVK